MTPKLKAKELFIQFKKFAHSDFHPQTGYDFDQRDDNAKISALIAVDQILYALNVPPIQNDSMLWKSQDGYWRKVKSEIEKL